MLTGKQRAYLRSLANTIPAKYQVGKAGFEDDAFLTQLREGLEKNELIKVTVLENSGLEPKEAGFEIAEQLGAEFVCATGRKLVFYRRSLSDKVTHIEF